MVRQAVHILSAGNPHQLYVGICLEGVSFNIRTEYYTSGHTYKSSRQVADSYKLFTAPISTMARARIAFLTFIIYAVALASTVAASPAPEEAVAKRNPLAETLEKRIPTRRGTAATEMTTCTSCASCNGSGCTGTAVYVFVPVHDIDCFYRLLRLLVLNEPYYKWDGRFIHGRCVSDLLIALDGS